MSKSRDGRYIIVKCYDKELYRKNNNGTISKAFKVDDPDVKEKIQAWRDEIKARNDEFTRKLKAGEIVTIRRVSKKQPICDVIPTGDAPQVAPSVPDPIAGASPVDLIYEKIHQVPRASIIPTIADRTKFELLLDPHTGNTTFILGSSKSGKSTALMKIYDKYYAPDKHLISILWTQNPQIKLYRGHKRLLKCGSWNDDGEELIRTEKKIQTATHNHYKFLNMFDDVLNVRNNTLLDNLILTYRNSKMSSIISLQYSNMLSKCGRANCNNVLAFNFNTDEAIEVVIKTFLTGYCAKIGLKSMADRINWYKSMTRDHGFIYIKPAEDHVSFHKFKLAS